MNILFELGWLGTLIYLVNHGALSVKPQWRSRPYFLINAAAALLLVLSSLTLASWQAVIINTFWFFASIVAVLPSKVQWQPLPLKSFAAFAALLAAISLLLLFIQWQWAVALLAWLSVYLFVLGYWLFSSSSLTTRQFFGTSFFAAISLLPQLWFDENWPVFVLEAAWALISLYGLFRTDTSVDARGTRDQHRPDNHTE